MDIVEEFRAKTAMLDFCDLAYCGCPRIGAGYAFDGKRLRPPKIKENLGKYASDGALCSNKKLQDLLTKKTNLITRKNKLLDFQVEGSWPKGFRFGAFHRGGQDLQEQIDIWVTDAGYKSYCEYYCTENIDDSIACFVLYSSLCQTELKARLQAPGVPELLELVHFYFSHTYPWRTNPQIINGTFKEKTIEVLKLTALGYSSKKIAEELHLTVRGVNYHIERAKVQLEAHSKAELINIAKKYCLF